ncbi:MAG: hypothetical protein HRU19_17915 [Pseudobacteriovorax sp.]|nr:hypothetical protein [Pseudobacteriovorax sp.]
MFSLKTWKYLAAGAAILFLLSRGGAAVLLTGAKIILPVLAFFYVTKKVTEAIFPSTREKKKLEADDDPNVIKICSVCHKQENSCLRCRMGFGKKNDTSKS